MKKINGWTTFDFLVLLFSILSPLMVSFLLNDSWVGMVSSIAGILYVFLCAKGKLIAYCFGIINCFAYAYLSAVEKLYGEVLLNLLYYVPLQVVGFLTWRRWMSETSHEVIPQRLKTSARVICILITLAGTFILGVILQSMGDTIAYVDAFTTVASVVAMTLTARRYIEQWYFWFLINALSIYMWTLRFLENGKNGTTLYMWVVFFLIGLYGYCQWHRRLSMKE